MLMRLISAVVACSCFYTHVFAVEPVKQQQQTDQTTKNTLPSRLTKRLSQARPAVVFIEVELPSMPKSPFVSTLDPEAEQRVRTFGSGFFISSDGLILTNAHVIQNAKSIVVRNQDGNEAIAQVVGYDSVLDLAVIQAPMRSSHFLSLDTSIPATVGEPVYAIGSSFGLPQSVTYGIVSALHRSISSPLQDFIQTDSAINQGNSGGPLINQNGQLIGVNTMIIGVQGGNNGVGFAIPVSLAKNVTEQIVQFGSTKPGRLGIHVQNLSQDMAVALGANADTKGVVVTEVIPGSPAQEISLKSKDIITQINGQQLVTAAQLAAEVYSLREGSDISLTIIRNGKSMSVRGQTNEISSPIPKPRSKNILNGVSLVRYDSLNHSGKMVRGVLVQDITQGSPGWLAGLMPGDVILQVGTNKVQSLRDVDQIKSDNKPLLLELIRNHKKVFLVLNP